MPATYNDGSTNLGKKDTPKQPWEAEDYILIRFAKEYRDGNRNTDAVMSDILTTPAEGIVGIQIQAELLEHIMGSRRIKLSEEARAAAFDSIVRALSRLSGIGLSEMLFDS